MALYIFWSSFYYFVSKDRIVGIDVFLQHLLQNNTDSLPDLWGGIEWFLTALFFSEIIYWILEVVIKNKWIRMITVFIISITTITAFETIIDFRFPLATDSALVAVSFYCMGDTFKEYLQRLFGEIALNLYIIICIIAGVTSIIVFSIIRGTNMRLMVYGNPFLYIIGAAAGCAMIVAFSMIFDKLFRHESKLYRWVIYIGSNTIILLYVHRLFDGLNKSLLEFVFHLSISGFAKHLYFFISVCIFFVICKPICSWINKHIPFMFGKN